MYRIEGPSCKRDVFVLGAGFSRAVSDAFPLTDKLGNDALYECCLDDGVPRFANLKFHDGNFEAWLSRLADGQPHLKESKNLENLALFSRMREAMVKILQLSEEATFTNEAPPWLYSLLGVLHAKASPVITFNYDTLIEVGALSCPLFDGGIGIPVSVDDLLADKPELPGPTSRRDQYGNLVSLNETFRLLKLHGSLDWFAAADDPAGATLKRAPLYNRFRSPFVYPEDQRSRELPGREPFLVPPSATKTGFYKNPIMRELWRGASEALLQADRIILIGYSIPVADLVFSGVLEEALQGREVKIEIVNPDPGLVVERLVRMGVGEEHIHKTCGANCVEQFVGDYAVQASSELVEALRTVEIPYVEQVGAFMSWGEPRDAVHMNIKVPLIRAISEVGEVRSDGTLVLQLGETGIPVIHMSKILESLEGVQRIAVNTKDGEVMVVGAWNAFVDEHHYPGQFHFAAGGRAI